jgi:serine protease AprX
MHISLLVVFLLLSGSLVAQHNFLIHFKDKSTSSYSLSLPEEFLSQQSIDRRANQNISLTEQDLPVSKIYILAISNTDFQVEYCSKWLNACLVEGDSSKLHSIRSLPFVSEIEPLDYPGGTNLHHTEAINLQYGSSAEQNTMLGIDQMHREGLTGKGKTIAILDGGFPNVDNISAFSHLVNNNNIVGTYNFPDHNQNVYKDHEHGTMVLSTLGAYWEEKIIGTAYEAQYLLLRTEDADLEDRKEEFYWLMGAEYADSAGADIISSSLGYNTFDRSFQNYTYQDLDGKTTLITRAAEWAFAKGILVVNSAGNEGQNSWKYILSPADGEHVLAVGAVTSNRNLFNSSSRGPSYDGRIKPDVMALGSGTTVLSKNGNVTYANGTSFAAPLITGFAANLWQKFPHFSNAELLELIKKSGDRANNPDNDFGYGIPSYKNVLKTQSKELNMQVGFVNPARDILEILWNSDAKFSCQLYDMSGRKVLERIDTQELNIDISHIQTGVYILHFFSKKESFRELIIIL